MPRKAAAVAVLNDHEAAEDEGLDQFDDEIEDSGDLVDNDEPGPLLRPYLEEQLKRPAGEILSAIALQGVSSHAKKRPLSALDDGWLLATWRRITGLLSDQPKASEAPKWRDDVQYIEAAAEVRGVDLFVGDVPPEESEPSAPAAADAPLDQGEFRLIPTVHLVESDNNPRKHFDAVKLEQLAASIRSHGVLTPLLAREVPGDGTHAKYELAAGHRRFRAAQMAGVEEVPVLVREMDDVQFLEVLTIENLQRDDVHPLEEAQGYHDLMKEASYTALRIGERVGKSEKYVWDRIKLLRLTKPAQQLFLDGRITAGHAILIARLKPEDQARIIDPQNVDYNGSDRAALWEHELQQFHPLHDAEERKARKEDPYRELKTKSVRELANWIDDHIRLDLKRDRDVLVFPEIAAVVAPAREMNLKVVPITYDHMLKDDARAEEKTYGNKSWKRADGKHGSKTCEYSVTGFVAAGPGRGEGFSVCVAKEKCKIHWKENVRRVEERKRADKKPATSTPKDAKAEQRAAAEAEKELQRQVEEQHEKDRYEAAIGDLCDQLAAHLKKSPAGGATKLGDYLVKEITDQFNGFDSKATAKLLPRGKSADDLVRHLALGLLLGRFDDLYRDEMADELKPFGFDLEKELDRVSPREDEKKPAAKPAKKKGR